MEKAFSHIPHSRDELREKRERGGESRRITEEGVDRGRERETERGRGMKGEGERSLCLVHYIRLSSVNLPVSTRSHRSGVCSSWEHTLAEITEPVSRLMQSWSFGL